MLIILFGLPGSGKTYMGELLKREYGFYFYDADKDLTPEIKKIIKQGAIVNEKLRDEYFNKVLKQIDSFNKIHSKLVVCQALTKEKHRQLIKNKFPESKFVLIKASEKNKFKRLSNRKHIIDKDYAEKIKKIFENPKIDFNTINNNGDKLNIIKKINKLNLAI